LQKSLPCKYFYDGRGSDLFEQICHLPEYYPTQTEMSILKQNASTIVEDFREGIVIEFGSGANRKIRPLFDAVFKSAADVCYVPIDVSETALVDASEELLRLYPALSVFGLIADFTKPICQIPNEHPKLLIFLGGTIGNFTPDERGTFFGNTASLMGPDDRLLVGIDMMKPKSILELAYNDSQGITAAFNKNVLAVVNRELKGNFVSADSDHLAFFDDAKRRVEMHLQAKKDTAVALKGIGLNIEIKKNETIRTEICCKFSLTQIGGEARAAGLKIRRWFSDPNQWFCVVEFMPQS